MSTFKQAGRFTFERIKFGNRTMYNSQTRLHFKKNSLNKVHKIIDQLHLPKSIPNLSLKFISSQIICEQYVVIFTF